MYNIILYIFLFVLAFCTPTIFEPPPTSKKYKMMHYMLFQKFTCSISPHFLHQHEYGR